MGLEMGLLRVGGGGGRGTGGGGTMAMEVVLILGRLGARSTSGDCSRLILTCFLDGGGGGREEEEGRGSIEGGSNNILF